MTLAIDLHDAAKRELDEATSIIAATHPRAAMRFLEAVRRDLEIIREYPLAGKRLRRSHLRQFVIDGWRHSIIYAVEDSVVLVFAFAHHSRKPGRHAARWNPGWKAAWVDEIERRRQRLERGEDRELTLEEFLRDDVD